jgi:hypothetical protein
MVDIESSIRESNRPFKEKRNYAVKALEHLQLNWRIGDIGDIGVYQHDESWRIDFFDADNHIHWVNLKPPFGADEIWYIEEIARQLREQLNQI